MVVGIYVFSVVLIFCVGLWWCDGMLFWCDGVVIGVGCLVLENWWVFL